MGRAQDVENEEQEQEHAGFLAASISVAFCRKTPSRKQPDPDPDHGDQGDEQRNHNAEFAGGIDPRIRNAKHHDEAADLHAPMPQQLVRRARDRPGLDGGRR